MLTDDEMRNAERGQLDFMREVVTRAEAGALEYFEELGKRLVEPLAPEDVTMEDVTIEHYEGLIKWIAARIRDWGNAGLADRYHVAHMHAWRTLKEATRWHVLRSERSLTDVESAQADAAARARNEAGEDVKRVEAEAGAFMKGLEVEGGG